MAPILPIDVHHISVFPQLHIHLVCQVGLYSEVCSVLLQLLRLGINAKVKQAEWALKLQWLPMSV